MGSSIAIIGFAIWPDSTRTHLLNYTIKTRPTVSQYIVGMIVAQLPKIGRCQEIFMRNIFISNFGSESLLIKLATMMHVCVS